MEKVSRRQFIQTAIGGSVAFSSMWGGVSAQDQPESPLKMGLIGCGWYGMVDANSQQIAGNPRARAMMKRDDRTPWQHPFKG